jgi:hypothetical protein
MAQRLRVDARRLMAAGPIASWSAPAPAALSLSLQMRSRVRHGLKLWDLVPRPIRAALMPRQRRIFSSTFCRSESMRTHHALPGGLGMWSNLLVAFLMFMPAFVYGTVLWLNYLQ